MDMGRPHLWSSDLEYVRTITPHVVATPAGVERVIPGPVLNDGSILGIALVFGASGEQPILFLEEDGSVRRVVAHASVDGRVVSLDLTTGPFNAPNPWADHPLWVSAADGQSVIVVDRRVAVAPRNSEYRIVRIDLRGDTVLAAPIEYDPVELSAASRNQAISQVAELVSRAREVTPVETERQVQAALTPPRYLVPVTEVVAGRDGTIWLRREDVRSDSVYWEVLGSSGERSGRGRLPADLRVSGADSNRVWGTVTNALGVPLVQVYQIQRDG